MIPSPSTAIDHLLRIFRAVGLVGLLGGLASLTALWAFGPRGETIEQWWMLRSVMRAIFYTCVFSGILILVPVGIMLWWRRRRLLRGARWFRTMMLILVPGIPTLHISARLTSWRLRDALEAGDIAGAAMLWDRLGWLFLAGFIVMMVAAFIAIAKPGMGQR